MASTYDISGGSTEIELTGLEPDKDFVGVEVLQTGLDASITLKLKQSQEGTQFEDLPEAPVVMTTGDAVKFLSSNSYKYDKLFLDINVGAATTGTLEILSVSRETRLQITNTLITDENAIHDNVAGEIVVITEKTLPVGDDEFIIEDSEDSSNKKSLKLKNIIQTTQDTNTASQALSATYAVLTGMTRSLLAGTYIISFSGTFYGGTNDSGRIAIFNGGTEEGGTSGHTERDFGITSGDGASPRDSAHTQALITLASTTTIDIRGKEMFGTEVTFEKGNMITTKVG